MGQPSSGFEDFRLSFPADHPQHTVDPSEVDCAPHVVERNIRRVLTSQPGLSVSSLVVRRVGDGVCLTGVIETTDGETDVCDLVKQVAGIDEVMNRMLVRCGAVE